MDVLILNHYYYYYYYYYYYVDPLSISACQYGPLCTPPPPQNLFCFVSPQRLQRQPNNVLKIFSNYSSYPLLIITTYRDEIPK